MLEGTEGLGANTLFAPAPSQHKSAHVSWETEKGREGLRAYTRVSSHLRPARLALISRTLSEFASSLTTTLRSARATGWMKAVMLLSSKLDSMLGEVG